jgi:hypothetical protein
LCFSLFVVGNRGGDRTRSAVNQQITRAMRNPNQAPREVRLRIIYVEDRLEEEILAD